MKITVIGCGRWGTFIAGYLSGLGHSVSLYGRQSSENMAALMRERRNALMELPRAVRLTTSLDGMKNDDLTVISVGSQGLSALCAELVAADAVCGSYVLCMKGIDANTLERLSEVAQRCLGKDARTAVWLGPGHVEDFCAGIPNCMVIDSEDEDFKRELVAAFSSPLIRFYYGTDLIGNEVGAASKNVIGIAAGMLDGLGLSSLKGALMSRGTREMFRLITAMGGNGLSAYGLCHLGDYEATVFSPHSHNRRFGEAFIRGEEYKALAEGYYTALSLHRISEKYGVELPISETVYRVLYEHADVKEELGRLFMRSQKQEF